MIVSGPPPALNEFEVSLFGPSYGEALAIHVGGGRWILIDSCLHPNGQPVSAVYLQSLGVQPSQVVALVASHWHDDHVAGLAQLAVQYPSAELFVPNYFSMDEGAAYVAAYSGAQAPQARGTRELYGAIRQSNPIPTGQRVQIFQGGEAPGQVVAIAFSPVPAAWGQAMAALIGALPTSGEQIKHAVLPKTNIASIVVHIEFGDDAVLLGSDLETHQSLGWQAVVASGFCNARRKASLYKVAHHGSKTADLPQIWTDLLVAKPVAAVTPYVNGATRLPDGVDIARIKAAAGALHCTSIGSLKAKMPHQSELLLKGIGKNLKVLNRPMGHWQFRKQVGSATNVWAAAAAGAAVTL